MKKFTVILLTIIFSLKVFSQEITFETYKKLLSENDINSVQIHKTFSNDIEIPLTFSGTPISSFSISGECTQYSDTSFVRITLEDVNGHEYLVYETNFLTYDKENAIFDYYYEETGLLENVIPKQLNLQIVDALIDLSEFYYTTADLMKNNEIIEANDQLRYQCQETKINLINQTLKRRNFKWGAGKTSISQLPFEEKKSLFNGKLPNLYGFEYYVGGIFEFPNVNKEKTRNNNKSNLTAVDNFDWRNRHGINWVTSVKRQIGGTCWAYTIASIVEASTNLYFNRKIDEDLSEFAFLTCLGRNCNSGGNYSLLNSVSSIGLINQECFPLDCNASCGDSCSTPQDRIHTNGTYYLHIHNIADPETQLKRHIITYGPGYGSIRNWSHAMTIVGFNKIIAGDLIYETSSYTSPISINTDDPRIGKTYWIYKNSWGENWGVNGYCYMYADVNSTNMGSFSFVKLPIRSRVYTESDRVCVDMDGDGYYNWGIGAKPATCPDCAPDEKDGNDNDPTIGPIDEYGHPILPFTPLTIPATNVTTSQTWANDTTFCGDLYIRNNSTLTLTGSISMQASHRIYVQSGSKLIVNGGKTSLAGITIKNGGTLTLNSDAIIEICNPSDVVVEQGGVFNYNYGQIKVVNPFN